jgi:DNA-binding NarL/FixJ family response regulator
MAVRFRDKRIRVGIVDDHAITRRALTEFLAEEGSSRVVGEAACGRGAIELARTVPMDVLLLDITMRGQSGIDALPHIVARENAPAVLMLSTHPQEAYGVAMIEKGASGYLNKQCEPEEIVRAIKAVAAGQHYLPCDSGSNDPSQPHRALTPREFQVFLRLAQGQSGQLAARDLSLSVRTFSGYRVRVMRKIDARTPSDLTYYAVKHNLLA